MDEEAHRNFEESGSEYEAMTGSEEEKRPPSEGSDKGSRKSSVTKSRQACSRRSSHSSSSKDGGAFRREALQWAATFQPPEADDIPTPSRQPADSRRKRPAPDRNSFTEYRARRVKGHYNDEYRELYNLQVEEAAAAAINDDHTLLDKTQIGTSIWTSEEKNFFFSALSRLGRDNIPGIALRIGSKSELEVHSYIQLLQQELVKRKFRTERRKLVGPADIPAAVQISEECCSVLEQTADALAIRQEKYEERIEEAKWGKSWLLTAKVSHSLEKQREQRGGERIVEDVLPAANFFDLENWLDLSETIFMNASGSQEEDNWQYIGEPGETPAIRATAFEDFHSLAINITKRLVSTTLFNTMSRLKAMDSNKTKHAEVSADDVHAAVKILSFPTDSNDFWPGCARRCHLEVLEDWESMSYEELEKALAREGTQFRSRSASRGGGSVFQRSEDNHEKNETQLPTSESDSQESDKAYSEDEFQSSEETDSASASNPADYTTTDPSDSENAHLSRRTRELIQKRKQKKRMQRDQHKYLEAIDTQASLAEEQQSWEMLRQSPPVELQAEEKEPLLRPKDLDYEMEEIDDWRHHLTYQQPWEALGSVVPEGAFAKNRLRRRRSRNPRSGRKSKGLTGSLAKGDSVLSASDLDNENSDS